MLRNVFLKTLRDQGRALLWWAIGVGGLVLYLAAFYPSMREIPEINKFIEQIPDPLLKTLVGEITDFTSPEGYLHSQLFFFMAPVIFLLFTLGQGSGAIAGEEERGTLDMLLANPLPRWRAVSEKFLAMIVAALVLAAAMWLGLAIGAVAVDMNISLVRLAETTVSCLLLALAFGTLALVVGCATGKRGTAMGIAGALAVAAYFVNSLAPIVDALKPYRKLSPFYYYIAADPLKHGLRLGHAAVLLSLTAVLFIVGVVAFQRRDLAV